ncbi:hypothetical protein NPIL_619501 [Nephila pilipes]|uniref:Uncharacterized protein n=1 Tax=Nephila pilipes TaxID=299642 RepID=A0A8X6ILZ1_NEPPI|nr:hypothetical protein NPIL_619501 [Nephila pilipes]
MFETVTIAWIFTATAVVFSFIKWYLSRNDDYWKKRDIPHNPRASFYKMYKETMEKGNEEILQLPYGKNHTFLPIEKIFLSVDSTETESTKR